MSAPRVSGARRTSRAPRCPESGRTWTRVGERDQCPNCGRMVRGKADGTTEEHTYPKFLRR